MHATPLYTRRTLAGSMQDFGSLIEDGALDVVRLRARSSESYSVEVDRGERFRFSIVASAPVNMRVAENRRRARFARVDQFSITLRPRWKASFVISLENAGARPVDVAVFCRTLPEAEAAGDQAATRTVARMFQCGPQRTRVARFVSLAFRPSIASALDRAPLRLTA